MLLFVALLLRLSFALEVWKNDLDLSRNDQLDSIFLHENARRIAEGDLRLAEPYLGHYADLRNEIYGPERYDRLFKPETYIDSPGYLYFAAACETVGGGSPYAVIFAQLILDVLACALVYRLARNVYGLMEARVALAAAALCLESVGHAGFMLRESSIALLATWCVYTLDHARRTGREGSWVLAGVVWGLGWTTKLTFVLLLPFVPLVSGRAPRKLAAFALGALLPIAPFVARNVSLGVPPLQMSATSLQIIAQRNMAGYEGVGEQVGRHAEIRRVLDASNDTAPSVLAAAIASHPTWYDYPLQLGRKLVYFFAPVDFWNNIRVTWLARLSPVLGVCFVWWGVLSSWALLGFLRALVRRDAIPLVGAFLALGVAPALLAGVYTRYRLVVEPIACVFFAATVVDAARAIVRKRWRGFAIVAACVLLRIGFEVVIFRDFPGAAQPRIPRSALEDYVIHTFPSRTAQGYLLYRVKRAGSP